LLHLFQNLDGVALLAFSTQALVLTHGATPTLHAITLALIVLAACMTNGILATALFAMILGAPVNAQGRAATFYTQTPLHIVFAKGSSPTLAAKLLYFPMLDAYGGTATVFAFRLTFAMHAKPVHHWLPPFLFFHDLTTV